MEASSQQCSSSLLHLASSWLPNSGIRIPPSLLSGGFEDINEDSFFSFYSSDSHHNVAVDVTVYGENCLENKENKDQMISSGDRKPSELIEPQSGHDQVTLEKTQMNKMRKNDQFRDVKRGKEKKRKKCQSTNEKEDIEKTPTPYVHVRARRGQATDSHSLAERARREKINKKMKQLQALVPGCDEINSKALVLDAIINYMKSIQSQVEFLSGKLALMNSMSYGFGWGLDIDDIMKLNTLAFCPIQPTVLPQDATTFITTNNYPILDSSTVCESQLQQGLSPFFFFQDNEDLLGEVEEQKQMLINQSSQFNDLCYF